MSRRWLRVSLLSLFAVMLVIALALGAFTWVMAKVPAYRTQMQVWLSERAKLDIQFDSLSAQWRGYGPELVFTQATLRSKDGQRVLAVADQGGVGFDLWQALLTGRLNAARFRLEGTELKLQRTQEGHFEFIGQADWPEFNDDLNFDLDALPVGELAIRKVKFSFRDLKTGRGPWSLSGVELDVSRDTDEFLVKGWALLSEELGKDLHFEAQGQGSLQAINQLEWQASIDGSGINLAGWKQVMPDDWPAPIEGGGSFHMNAQFTGGQLHAFGGNINFEQLALSLPAWQLPLPQPDVFQQVVSAQSQSSAATVNNEQTNLEANPWNYSKVALAFEGRSTAQGWLTKFSNFQLERADSPWPASQASVLISFTKQSDGSRSLEKIQATAQTLVLDNLWPLLAYLPENETHAYWRALRATGQIKELDLSYEKPVNTESLLSDPLYSLKFKFDQLGALPVNKKPGIASVSGQFSATNSAGTVAIDSNNAAITLPRLFRTPLPMDQVKGNLSWTHNEQGISLRSDDVAIENSDGKLQATLNLVLPKQGEPVIDAHANIQALAVESVPRYLPAGIMHEHVLNWLDAAFLTGKVTTAEATLKGPLRKFPFHHQEGEFLVNAQVEGLTLQYQKGWLPATELTVAAQFHNSGFSAVATSGKLNGLNVEQIEGGIKDFRDAQLVINGRVSGGLSQGLSFVQRSPVGPAIGDLFQHLTGKGSLQAQVALNLPLKQLEKHKVDIDLAVTKSTLTLPAAQQVLSDLSGRLHIRNTEVTSATLSGRLMQGNFNLKAEPVAGGHYTLIADGQLQAQPLMQFLQLPAWVKLSGATTYRLSMPGYVQKNSSGVRGLYSVSSDLQGLQIDLPEPFGKLAKTQRSLMLNVEMPDISTMQVRASLGELRSLARFKQQKNSWQFDRAGLRADGVAAALPAHTGLRVEGKLDQFSLDEWLHLDAVSHAKNTTASAVQVQDVLRAANVTIDHFYLYGFEWPSLRALLQATESGWRVNVSGDHASGQVNVPYAFTGGQALTLNMDTLWLQTRATAAGKKVASTLSPKDLPAIHAEIKQLKFGDHDFGAMQLSARRTAQGIEVDQLHFTGDTFDGSAQGRWVEAAGGQHTALALTLDSKDVRGTLSQLNYGEAISGKRGKLIANLQWPGGIDAQMLGRASGTIEVQVDEGQLLNVEPGAGRVLGLLSITALPRRLGLDFRDLTNKGLAFDTIHADFTVSEGNARTQNLILRGPTAEIGIAGRIGLGARDYDQTAAVASNVSSALPVAAVAVGAPVVGAAIALFSQIFKEPLKGVSRAYYHIGGRWDDPKVERIDSDIGKASMSGTESGATP